MWLNKRNFYIATIVIIPNPESYILDYSTIRVYPFRIYKFDEFHFNICRKSFIEKKIWYNLHIWLSQKFISHQQKFHHTPYKTNALCKLVNPLAAAHHLAWQTYSFSSYTTISYEKTHTVSFWLSEFCRICSTF